jgi:uncharacterized protein (DUF1778 family)
MSKKHNPLEGLKTTRLELTQEQWDKFIDTINNPPEPSEKLKELFRKYGKFLKD